MVLEYWGDCTDYSLLGRQSTEGWYWSIGGTVLTILYWGGSQQRGGIGVLGDCTDYSLLGRQSTEGWYWSIGGTVLTILYWGGSQQRGGIGVLGGLY